MRNLFILGVIYVLLVSSIQAQTCVMRVDFEPKTGAEVSAIGCLPKLTSQGQELLTETRPHYGQGSFHSAKGQNSLQIQDINALIAAKDGFTIAFWVRPLAMTQWKALMGFRLGNHNYRLENYKLNAVGITLYQDDGKHLRASKGELPGTLDHEKNNFVSDQWASVVLTYKDHVFKLYKDNVLIDTYDRLNSAMTDTEGLKEITIGRGRDCDPTKNSWKQGLAEDIDQFVVWRGVVAPEKAFADTVLPGPDGSLKLAPTSGPLPSGIYLLRGGTLRLAPCQAINHQGIIVKGYGRIEIECSKSDLEIALSTQDFKGDVCLIEGKKLSKLRTNGLTLGPATRFVMDPTTQLFITTYDFKAPSMVLTGTGETNGERFGGLRMGFSEAVFTCPQIEVKDTLRIAPYGRIVGRFVASQGEVPTLIINGAHNDENVGPMEIDAFMGTTLKPMNVSFQSPKKITLRGSNGYAFLEVSGPVEAEGKYSSAERVEITSKGSLTLSNKAGLETLTIKNKGRFVIGKEGWLKSATTIEGAVIFEDGACIHLEKPMSLRATELSVKGQITLTGTLPKGCDRLRILEWVTSQTPITIDNFKLSDGLQKMSLEVTANAVCLRRKPLDAPTQEATNANLSSAQSKADSATLPAMQSQDLPSYTTPYTIQLLEEDNTPAHATALPSAGHFILSGMHQKTTFKRFTLKVFGESTEGVQQTASKAADTAYLLNIQPVLEIHGNQIEASYAYNFGISEVHRTGEDKVDVRISVEPFDEQGILGECLNGYVQVLGKTSATDQGWTVLAEVGPGTPYQDGMLTLSDVKTSRRGKIYRLFGVRLQSISYKKQ